MVTDQLARGGARRRTIAGAHQYDDAAAFLTHGARSSALRRFFRRDEIGIAHRCLAIHIYFAGPHSAME